MLASNTLTLYVPADSVSILKFKPSVSLLKFCQTKLYGATPPFI